MVVLLISSMVVLLISTVVLFAALPMLANARDVMIGDTLDVVKDALGEPRGYMKSEDYQLLQYERGLVELHDGLVSSVSLVSEQDAEKRRIERERIAEERRLARATRREELRIEGQEILEQVRNDPEFAALPAAEQVEFWRSFKKRYRDVPPGEEYAAVLERHKQELEQQALEHRIADLESRVREAESRVAQAEEEVARASYDNRRRYVSYGTYAYSYPTYYRPSRYSHTSVSKHKYGLRYTCKPTIKAQGYRHVKKSSRHYTSCKSPRCSSYKSPYVTSYKSPYYTSCKSPYTTTRNCGSAQVSFRAKY